MMLWAIQVMSKKISIDNFLMMNPSQPEFSQKNQHYLISGANPTYYNDIGGVQEEQVAPLIASNKFSLAYIPDGGHGSVGTQHITSLIPSTAYSTSSSRISAYGIDATGYVFGYQIVNQVISDFGAVISGISSPYNILNCFANVIIAIVYTGIPGIYYSVGGTSWTSMYPVVLSGGTGGLGQRYMENFGAYCMISDGLTSVTTMSKVKKLDSSFNYTTGIDLGNGWTVNGMRNFNDKYIAIAGSLSYSSNYLFLWDGSQDEPNYSMKMDGNYLDMIVIDGVLYVAVALNGTNETAIFYLKGTQLVKLMTPQISKMGAGDKAILFNFGSKLGINLSSTDLMVYGDSAVGKEEFVLTTGTNYTHFCITLEGYLLTIGYSDYLPYYYNITSTNYNPIKYVSQWIPVHNLSGIDVWYDTPPQTANDFIDITLDGQGEDIITGASSVHLIPPVAGETHTLSMNTTLTNWRTRVDVQGFAGDLARITLTTTVGQTGGGADDWRPIIRGLDLITN